LGKLGRKVCCNFNRNVKCLLLVKGHKSCVFEETTAEQRSRGEVQFGFCVWLPLSEREAVLAEMKKKGFASQRSWGD
jgi:hypothetical protein